MLLVLGLDGADWAILDPLLAAGHLPHLAALCGRGRRGLLQSTIRPESSIAWTTFATGVNAGRHSVYSFSAQRPDSYETTLVASSSIRYPAFWQTAAAAGKRVALLNVPMTYPPQPLPGGACVAGMLAPSVRSPFVWPPEWRERLLAAAPGYTVALDHTGLSLRRFLHETTQSIRARTSAACWLAQQAAWDALVVVFTETDRMQHYSLHLTAPEHPRHDAGEAAALQPALLAAYQAIDDGIGELLVAAGPDATVIVLSDHGFAACARAFRVNVWLEQQGLLRRRDEASASPGWRESAWRRLRSHPRLRRMKQSLPLLRDWQRPPASGGELTAIDWSRTAAVYSPAGGIRLNIQGREPQGMLSADEADVLGAELSQRLLEVVDPLTGHPVIAAVHRRQDLYHGPYLDYAPDLILEPCRRHPDPTRVTLLAYDFAGQVFGDSGDLTGNHTLEGIFLAAGPDIQPGSDDGVAYNEQRTVLRTIASLLDAAPTILYALGLPIPADLEGRVLPLWNSPMTYMGSPNEGQRQGAQVRLGFGSGSTSAADALTPSVPAFEVNEQAAIERHLRSLGYL